MFNHPGTLLSGALYSALGGLASASLGNGAIETMSYDARGRLACETVVNGSTTLYNLGLSNTTSACLQSGSPAGPPVTNGDVLKYVDSVNGTWANTYDDMNRLVTATQAPGVGPLGSGGGPDSNPYSPSESTLLYESLFDEIQSLFVKFESLFGKINSLFRLLDLSPNSCKNRYKCCRSTFGSGYHFRRIPC